LRLPLPGEALRSRGDLSESPIMPIPSPTTCRICSKPLTLHERFAGDICSDWRCRWRNLDAQLETHRSDAAEAVGEKSAESFPITVVPFHTRPTVPVSEEERQELLSFLRGLLQEISSHEHVTRTLPTDPNVEQSGNAEASEDVAALLGKVCGVCAGFCCHHGATNHAFLDDETLLRFLAQHPDMPAGEAIMDFVGRVPTEHYKGSCIYHTKTGCNLPRDMRARICNAYECRGLKDARQHFANTDVARVFVVVRHDNRIMHSAFVEVTGQSHEPSVMT
jgi:hypothetical protein